MDRKKLYPLDFLLLIIFLSTLSGCTSWYEIEDYGVEYEDELKRLYEQLTGHQLLHTMPSHDTLDRSISLLNVSAFEKVYKRWIEAFIRATSGRQICIDGKSNEIPAIHKLLQTLDLNGAIVSIDA